jgi:hypothetical protein
VSRFLSYESLSEKSADTKHPYSLARGTESKNDGSDHSVSTYSDWRCIRGIFDYIDHGLGSCYHRTSRIWSLRFGPWTILFVLSRFYFLRIGTSQVAAPSYTIHALRISSGKFSLEYDCQIDDSGSRKHHIKLAVTMLIWRNIDIQETTTKVYSSAAVSSLLSERWSREPIFVIHEQLSRHWSDTVRTEITFVNSINRYPFAIVVY